MAGIGHNSGQTIAPGHSWRKHSWTKARKTLLPVLPIEVVRLRVNRAQQLGLPYKTYAGIRASTGHDLIGFMFSNNALRVIRADETLPLDRAQKLESLVQTRRIGIAHAPVTAHHLSAQHQIDDAFAAPAFTESWSQMRQSLKDMQASIGAAADRYVLIGDTAFEHEWVAAAKMAGYLPADAFFGQDAQQ